MTVGPLDHFLYPSRPSGSNDKLDRQPFDSDNINIDPNITINVDHDFRQDKSNSRKSIKTQNKSRCGILRNHGCEKLTIKETVVSLNESRPKSS